MLLQVQILKKKIFNYSLKIFMYYLIRDGTRVEDREDQEFFFFGEEEINTCLYTQKISFRDESKQTFTFLEIKLFFYKRGPNISSFSKGEDSNLWELNMLKKRAEGMKF